MYSSDAGLILAYNLWLWTPPRRTDRHTEDRPPGRGMQAAPHQFADAAALAARYRAIRAATKSLCAPLSVEDFQLQSMPDCSPPKWHLAHTTWFFETFVLTAHAPQSRAFHPQFSYLFNS